MPRLAANISTMFQEWSILDRVDAAADAGFDLVECQFPYTVGIDALAGRLERNGVAMVMFNTPPGDVESGELGFAALPGRFADLCSSVERAADVALALGVSQIHLLAGRSPPGPEGEKAFKRSVKWAAERVAEAGLGLLIEPINPIDNPGYHLTDFDQARAIIQDLAQPNLGLQFDLYHCRKAGRDVADTLDRLLPLIRHVQVSSVPDRGEPKDEDIAILAKLDRLGYAGVVGCEYVPRAGTVAGLGWRDRF